MSIDQIYKIAMMIIAIVSMFIGYQWGKSTVKLDARQNVSQKTQDKNITNVNVYVNKDAKVTTKST